MHKHVFRHFVIITNLGAEKAALRRRNKDGEEGESIIDLKFSAPNFNGYSSARHQLFIANGTMMCTISNRMDVNLTWLKEIMPVFFL